MTVAQQGANARAMGRWQQQRHASNRIIAEQAAHTQYGQLQTRTSQERAAASQQMEEARRRRMQAEATATVAAGEGGAMGASFDAIMGEYERQESAFRYATLANLRYGVQQRSVEMQAVRGGMAGRILSTMPQPVAMPNYVGAALGIAGRGAGLYARAEE